MVKLVIGGDTTLTGLIKPLTEQGYEVEELGFNVWHIELMNPNSKLRLKPPDFLIIILSPRFSDFEQLELAISHLDGKSTVLFSSLVPDPLRPLPLIHPTLKNLESKHPWFHLIDMSRFFALHGIQAIHDARYEVLARMYFSPKGIELLAGTLARFLHALTHPPKKVLALDLDNTLWGGILGEEEIQIGQEGIGYAYTLFQKALLELKNKGILLVLCSKNNFNDVLKAFEKEMTLKLSDFAAVRINWESKADNLKSIADELNLNLDSFAFFDDSSFEREQLKKMLPQVDCIEVPQDPAYYVDALSNYWGFDSLTLTEEDLKRSELYLQDKQRKELKQQHTSLEDFFKSLNMEVEIKKMDESAFPRVLQLIHKTNQFNMTTKRYSEADLKNLSDVYTLKLKDKLGDNGLTGVLIINKEGSSWIIDTLLLSCRIIGRGVEFALIEWLGHLALKEGADELVGQFIPTSKNMVAKDFYKEAGFSQAGDRWILKLNELNKVPRSYVKIN